MKAKFKKNNKKVCVKAEVMGLDGGRLEQQLIVHSVAIAC